MKTFTEILNNNYGIKVCKSQYKWLAEYLSAIPQVVKDYIFGDCIPTKQEFKDIIYTFYRGISHILYYFPEYDSAQKYTIKELEEYDMSLYYEVDGTSYKSPICDEHPSYTFDGKLYYKDLYDRPCIPWVGWYNHDFNGYMSYMMCLKDDTDEQVERRNIIFNYMRDMFKTVYQKMLIVVNKDSMEDVPIIWTWDRPHGFFRKLSLEHIDIPYVDENGEHKIKYGSKTVTIKDIEDKHMCLRLSDLKYHTFDEAKEISKK